MAFETRTKTLSSVSRSLDFDPANGLAKAIQPTNILIMHNKIAIVKLIVLTL